jgi:hypothetical protein
MDAALGSNGRVATASAVIAVNAWARNRFLSFCTSIRPVLFGLKDLIRKL